MAANSKEERRKREKKEDRQSGRSIGIGCHLNTIRPGRRGTGEEEAVLASI